MDEDGGAFNDHARLPKRTRIAPFLFWLFMAYVAFCCSYAGPLTIWRWLR